MPSGQSTDSEGIQPACIQPRIESRRSLRVKSWEGPCFRQIASTTSTFQARALDHRSDESKSTRQKAFKCERVLEAARVAATELRRRVRRPRRVWRSAGEAPNTHSSDRRHDLLWRSVALISRLSIFPGLCQRRSLGSCAGAHTALVSRGPFRLRGR